MFLLLIVRAPNRSGHTSKTGRKTPGKLGAKLAKKAKKSKSKKPRKKRKPSVLDYYKKVHDDRDRAFLAALVADGQETIKSKKGLDIVIMSKNGKIRVTTLSSYQGQLWTKLTKEEQQTYIDNAITESAYGSDTD